MEYSYTDHLKYWSALLAIAIMLPATAYTQGFSNVAPSLGLNHQETGDSYGSGMSFFDFDQDGWDDLTFARNNDSIMFYRNIGGTFEQLPSFVYGNGQVRHVLWADYDNDGDMDLLVTTFNGNCRLYNNNGNFAFTDVTASSGIIIANEKHYGASFGDYDKDGYLDLYICTYEHQGDTTFYNRLNHLYRNNGDGTFTDVTLAAGVGDGIKLSFGSIWFDYDMDGWPDLFVMNDRWFANSLYRNNGNGTFTDVTNLAGVGFPNHDPMSLSLADMDNDGDLDLFLSNSGFLDKHCMLLVNNGDGTFSEEAIARGIELYAWAWGGAWVDITNNGRQDLFITTAQPGNTSDPNFLYGNIGNGQFVQANNLVQGSIARSFSPVIGDYDNDGFADMAVQNQTPHPPYLYKNLGGPGHYIKVTLQGTVSNKQAVGSYIRVTAGGQTYMRYTLCGENYIGQSSQHQIIGLGNASTVDSVQIEYLSGHIDTYYGLAANQSYTFTEGETYQAEIIPDGPLPACPGTSLILDGGDHEAWLWNTGHEGRYLTITAPGEYSITVWSPLGIEATDQITITYAAAPEITPAIAHPNCFGNATGSILLQAAAGTDLSTVIWNDQTVGALNTGLAAGTHGYTYTDQQNCTFQWTVQLTDPPELVLTASSTAATAGNNGSIQVTVTGGTPPYTVLIDGNETGLVITGLAWGIYELQVNDAADCSVTLNVYVDITTSLIEHFVPDNRLHPNPVRTWFETGSDEPVHMLQIWDARGRLVLTRSGPVSGPVDASSLVPGTYMVSYKTAAGGTEFQRMIKIP